MQNTTVGLKELCEHIDTYIKQVKRGKTFIVIRRAKPLFKMTPLSRDEDETLWERVVDFTKLKRGGVSIVDLLSRL